MKIRDLFMNRILVTILGLAPFYGMALTPPTEADFNKLKQSSDFTERVERARSQHNHLIATGLLKQAQYRDSDISAMLMPSSDTLPTEGDVRIVVIPIEFTDYPHTESKAQLTDKLFGPAQRSITEFFKSSSYGKLNITGQVLDWYSAPMRKDDVFSEESLIKSAIKYHDQKGIDFSQFDNRNNGKIDYVVIIWTGPEQGWGDFWWGKYYGGFDPTFSVDGKTIGSFSWQPLVSSHESEFSTDTVIHETGHALGLPDLYDYTGTYYWGHTGAIGLMANSWGGDINPYFKRLLGWVDPNVQTSGNDHHQLMPTSQRDDILVVGPRDSLFDEQFVIQRRDCTGIDSNLPGLTADCVDGGLIWHINPQLNVSGNDFEYDNSFTETPFISVVTPKGDNGHLLNGLSAESYFSSNDEFSPNSMHLSKLSDGSHSGVTVSGFEMQNGLLNVNTTVQPVVTLDILNLKEKDELRGSAYVEYQIRDESEPLKEVELYINDLKVGSSSSASGKISFSSKQLAGGSAELSLVATTAQGSASTERLSVFFKPEKQSILIADLGKEKQDSDELYHNLNAFGYNVIRSDFLPANLNPFDYSLVYVNYGAQGRHNGVTLKDSELLNNYYSRGGNLWLEVPYGLDWNSEQTLPSLMKTLNFDTHNTYLNTADILQGHNLFSSFSFDSETEGVEKYGLSDIRSTSPNTRALWSFVQNGSDAEHVCSVINDARQNIAIIASCAFDIFPKSEHELLAQFYSELFHLDSPLISGKRTKLDYDGDGKSDIAVRNANKHELYAKLSDSGKVMKVAFGRDKLDIPIEGDFDGDGVADVAVRRPSTQMWYVKTSKEGEILRVNFGKQEEDIPVAEDYDGDGITDFAVRRPSTQMWYILNSSNGEIQRHKFGLQSNDIPIPQDYDGDGITDIAVWRESSQMWYAKLSTNGSIMRVKFGEKGDIPVKGDFDGDGIDDIAVRRTKSSTWHILNSSDSTVSEIKFGLQQTDIPITADYDGDGKTDLAVRRSDDLMQYVLRSSDKKIDRIKFGLKKDYLPVAAPVSIKTSMLSASNMINANSIPAKISYERAEIISRLPAKFYTELIELPE